MHRSAQTPDTPRVTATDEARARRIAFGMRSGSAAFEAARFRTLGGVRLAERLERGFQARSSVLIALRRREAALIAAGAGRRAGGYIDPTGMFCLGMLAGLLLACVVASFALAHRARDKDGRRCAAPRVDVWPDEVCEVCGRAGAEMDGGCRPRGPEAER